MGIRASPGIIKEGRKLNPQKPGFRLATPRAFVAQVITGLPIYHRPHISLHCRGVSGHAIYVTAVVDTVGSIAQRCFIVCLFVLFRSSAS